MRNAIVKFLKRRPALFYLVYATLYKWQIWKATHLVIVTTPGHVGSSTTFKSLQTGTWPKGTRIYDIHSLNEGFNNASKIHSISARHVLQQVLSKMLQTNSLNSKKISVISVTRDPVARALGAIFQNGEAFLSSILSGNVMNYQAISSIKSFMLDKGYLHDTMQWYFSFYESELKNKWGLDVYEFKKSSNEVLYYQNGNRQALIFTLENLDSQLVDTINEIYGTEIVLSISNSVEQRDSKNINLYNFCKQHLTFSENTLKGIYNYPFMIKVYTEDVLFSFEKKWRDK
ncbi:hypothetical protein [Fulvivirga sp.]|uniref:hypothetical protein n=1 Tax=Fulvivirga sp. TaxID=1931237 RepID=UPI0032EDDB20